MIPIKTEFFDKNGIKYQRDIFEHGETIEFPCVDPDEPVSPPKPEDEPIPIDEMLESMALNIDYLVALQGMEGGDI